jgi:hypothetical protein
MLLADFVDLFSAKYPSSILSINLILLSKRKVSDSIMIRNGMITTPSLNLKD